MSTLPTFTIPKKKAKKTSVELEKEIPAPSKENWSAKEVNLATSSAEKDNILSIFFQHALNKDVWKFMTAKEMRIFKNDYLEWKFDESKRKFRSEGVSDAESFAFREIGRNIEEKFIAKNGLRVGSNVIGDIGDPQLGVYVYKHPDTVSSTFHYYENVPIHVMLFKTLRGKTANAGLGSGEMEPQIGYNCHVAALTEETKKCAKRRVEHRLSAVYHYEMKSDGMSTHKYPATVLPYAFVKFQMSLNLPDETALFRDPFGFVTPKFHNFDMYQLSENSVELKIPGQDVYLVYIKTPIRNHEVPNGLYDLNLEFADGPFFPYQQLAEIPEMLMLQNDVFGQLIHYLELSSLPNDRKATYNLLTIDEEAKNKESFAKMLDLMRMTGTFIGGIDACQAQHFLFPSGEVATSFGFPFLPNVLHCISIFKEPFLTNEMDYASLAVIDNRYLIANLGYPKSEPIEHMEIKTDNEFELLHNENSKEYDILHQLPMAPDEFDEPVKILPPVPLPPAGKGILYVPPPSTVGVLIGHQAKRRPNIRVHWAKNVVDNDNKEKNSNMLAMEKEERMLTEDQKRQIKQGNDEFKNAITESIMLTMAHEKEKATSENSINAFGVNIEKMKMKEKTIEQIREEKRKEESVAESLDEILKTPVTFSSIKELPLPARVQSTLSIYEPEAIDETTSVPIDSEEIEEKKKKAEDVGNEEIEHEKEKEESEEKKEEEENDILKLCFSSSRPKEVEKAPTVVENNPPLLSVLNLSAETMEILLRNKKPTDSTQNPASTTTRTSEDLDLRQTSQEPGGSTTVAFQLNKGKKLETPIVKPINNLIFREEEEEDEDDRETLINKKKNEDEDLRRIESKDKDYRKDKDHQKTLSKDRDERKKDKNHHHHHQQHQQQHHHNHHRNNGNRNEKNEMTKSIPMPTPATVSMASSSSSSLDHMNNKKKLDNQLQGFLRQCAKDIDLRVDEKAQSGNVGKVPSCLDSLGINPHMNSKTAPIMDSPASPPPEMIVRSDHLIAMEESPESPQTVEIIEEIQEIDEPMNNGDRVPATILPLKQPVVVPVEGKEGWETVFGGKKSVTEVTKMTNRKSKRASNHHDSMTSSSTMKEADDSWMNAIQKRVNRNDEKEANEEEEEEEEGEITSDVEEAEKGKNEKEVEEINEDGVEIVKDNNDVRIVEVPQIVQDRDERITRKSRFDAPPPTPTLMPPIAQHHQQQLPPMVGAAGVSRGPSRFGPPPPSLPSQQQPTMFMNRPIGGFMPSNLPTMRHPMIGNVGGPPRGANRMPPSMNNLNATRFQFFPSAAPLKTNTIVIVADSMIFHRAVMDSNVFRLLMEKLRSNLMMGRPTKLLVHQNIYQRLMASTNHAQQSYRAALLAHKDAIVIVMDRHSCDEENYQQAKVLSCLATIKQRHQNDVVILLSNISSDSEQGRHLSQLGIRIMKLERLLQDILKL